MRKWILLVGILALGLAWAECGECGNNECDTCSGEDEVTQEITVEVPVIVKLVLDEGELSDWYIKPGQLEDCYAIPNQVTKWSELKKFLQNPNQLVEASDFIYIAEDKTTGTVKKWYEVVDNINQSPYAPYANEYAKGSVVCMRSFKVEKYTNCEDGALFSVSLSTRGDSNSSGFGLFIVHDVVTAPNKPEKHKFVTFRLADGGSKTLTTIGPGLFYDDNITQWIWLRTAKPGTYELNAVYTLAAPIPTE